MCNVGDFTVGAVSPTLTLRFLVGWSLSLPFGDRAFESYSNFHLAFWIERNWQKPPRDALQMCSMDDGITIDVNPER
jgi:hypothetical protein